MEVQTFLDNFGAIAQTPDGINHLRQLILNLAVRGKLVEQDPSESTDHLLEEAAEQRSQLEESKEIRKLKIPQLTVEDIPYSVPPNWSWVRIPQVSHDLGQKVPDEDFSYLDVSAIDQTQGVVHRQVAVIVPEEAPSRARKKVKQGTLIYSTVRPYLRNIAVIESSYDPPPIASTAFVVLHPFSGIAVRYLYICVRSPYFTEYVESQQKGVAYPAINDGDFQKAPIPLPPTEEQHRIVAKVDELMALCDQLETQQQTHTQTATKLRASALNALTTAETADDLQTAWERILTNWEALSTDVQGVNGLQRLILNLAMRGRLTERSVDQIESSNLFEAAKADLELLKSTGRVSRHTLGEPLGSSERPDDLPEGWALAQFGQVTARVSGNSTLIKGKLEPEEAPGLFPGYSAAGQDVWLDHFESEGDAVVVSAVGARCGKAFKATDKWSAIANTTVLWPLTSAMTIDYLMLIANNENFWIRSGGAQPFVAFKPSLEQVVWVPPVAEQHRIVAKVNELMALCDELETRLVERDQLGEALAASVVDAFAA